MKKKLLTVLLSIFVMMGTFTTRVFAATTVSTWDDLKTAIDTSTTSEVITLGGDITVTETYTIASGKDITIELNGHTINGNGNQIFVLSGKLKIQDSVGEGKITGGANSGGSGGAVAIKGTGELTLESGTFTGNSAKSGGAISIDEENGKFIMNGGKISNNTASTNGAGIFASLLAPTYIEMNGGEISGNIASSFGGGIYIRCTEMKLNGGKIINNTAGLGAGICISDNADTKLYLGGNSVVKDNANSSSNTDNIHLYGPNSKLYISEDNPLTSGAEFYVTKRIVTTSSPPGDWGPGRDVGQYFNGTMTDSNYQYFYFTNCGDIETNTVYSVTKSGSNYVTTVPPICKIGSTGYATLGEALSAVNSEETITLLDDIIYNDGQDFVIDGTTVTIDFDGHSIAVNITGMTTVNKLFRVENSGNLIIENGQISLSGMYNTVSPFTVTGAGSSLTLNNYTQTSNLDRLLTLDGGTATINGGTFGTSDTATKITLKNNATLTLTNNPIFNCQGNVINISDTSNTDKDTLMGNVTIESGTFNGNNTIGIVALYGNANVTINNATFTSLNNTSAPIFIGNSGYKSSLTINNLTSDSPYVFGSNNNPNIGSFTATINDGHYKYTKGQFAIDRNNSLKPNIKLNGGYYGPIESSSPVADDDALAELTANCASGYQVEVLDTTDSEYANGYRYKIYNNNPTPTPTPTSDSTPRYKIPNTGVEGTPNNHSLFKLSTLSLLAIGTYIAIKKKKDNQ